MTSLKVRFYRTRDKRPLPSLVRCLFLGLICLASLCGETITYTLNTPTYPLPGASTFDVPRFQAAPGEVLTSISLTLQAVSMVSIEGFNEHSGDTTYTYHTYAAAVVPFPSLFLSPWGFNIYMPATGSFVAPPGQFSYSALKTGSSTYTVTGTPAVNSEMPDYMGSGTKPLLVYLSEAGPDGFGPGPSMNPLPYSGPGISLTSWSAQLSVTYTYSVPEPATWALFAMGGLLLIWRGSRTE